MNIKKFKATIGIIALICGIIGLGLAVSSNNGGFIYDSSTPELKKESLREKGVSLLKQRFLGKEKEIVVLQKPRGFMVENVFVLTAGLISVVLGICSRFIRQQGGSEKQSGLHFHFDTAGAGLTLGLIALLWSYMIIAVIIGIVIFVLFSLLNGAVDIGV
jgi:hypothetical protein